MVNPHGKINALFGRFDRILVGCSYVSSCYQAERTVHRDRRLERLDWLLGWQHTNDNAKSRSARVPQCSVYKRALRGTGLQPITCGADDRNSPVDVGRLLELAAMAVEPGA